MFGAGDMKDGGDDFGAPKPNSRPTLFDNEEDMAELQSEAVQPAYNPPSSAASVKK